MKSSIVIISNPAARSSSFEKVRKAAGLLQQKGFDVELLLTEKQGHATDLAKEAVARGPRFIIAAGGDGTINEVLNGMVMSDIPLAVLPLGTSNVLARELGIPRSVQGAVDRALAGRQMTASLGRIVLNHGADTVSRCFCLMAGIGFDASAVHDARSSVKKISGEGAYILSGIVNLVRYNPAELSLAVDGREYKGYAAIIGKASRYGGRFTVTPDARLGDPWFHLCIFQGSRRLDLLRYALGVVRGTHLQNRDVVYLKAREVLVSGEAHLQADGDYLGRTPAKITVAESALKILY